MNYRINLVLLLLVAILAGWYGYQNQRGESDLSQLIKREGMPEYTGEKMTTSVYDLQGQPQYIAEAEEVKRYESSDRTEFIRPFLSLFDQTNRFKEWKVTADYAELTKEKQLHLVGNVKIESQEANSRLQRITTDKLTIDLTTQDIFTDSPVKSVGQGFITEGVGLKGNLKQQVATLTKDVKTSIEPMIIKPKTTKDSQ